MNPCLLDTNILTAYLKANSQVVAQVKRHLDEVGRPSLSIITYYELLRGLKELGRKRDQRLAEFEDLVNRLHLRIPTHPARVSAPAVLLHTASRSRSLWQLQAPRRPGIAEDDGLDDNLNSRAFLGTVQPA